MDQKILNEIRALRQDLETQTAINIVEGINTVETLALLGHWMNKKRAPTQKEISQLSQSARERWVVQVRHLIGVGKKEPGGLDASLSQMFEAMVPARTRKKARKKR